MPRQIDAFPGNLQVNNDPTKQLGVSADQINSLRAQVPIALEKAEILFVNSVLDAIDQATGWDLLDFAKQVEAQLGNSGNLGTDLWNYIFGVGNNGTAALQQLSAIIQGIFGGAGTAFDLTAWLQQVETNASNAWNELEAFFATGDWADLTAAWDDLFGITTTANNNATNALQQLSAIIQGILGGSGTAFDLATWLQGVEANATAAWEDIQDFLETGDWNDLTAAIQQIYQTIFGSSTSLGLVGLIPAPAVIDVVQNLQPVWDFPDAASLSGAGTQWSWDGTVDHTGTAGSGSAKVVADGVLQALRGTPGSVSPGQTVTPSAWVMWSGLTASGSPIQLQLTPFAQSGSELAAGTPVVIAQKTSPGSSSAWTQLTGTYLVPSSGVAAVQVRLVVTDTASAGTVWWDDCHVDVSGGFLADLQADTNSIIGSFAPGGTAAEFEAGVTNLLALFGLTPADVGGATVIDTVWTDVINGIVNPLNALEVQAANIIGDIEQSAINGLAATLSALLGTTTFQTLLDSVANALGHSGTGHTIANIETYLGIIPPTNVTNVLGGANLGADVSSVHATTSTLTTNLSALQTNFNAGETAFAALIASWYTTLTTGGQAWSTVLTALDSAWNTYITANSAVNASVSATITDIIANLFGFDPTSGLMDPNNVAGLGDSFTQLGAALSGDAADAGDWAWLATIMANWFGVSSDAHGMAVDNTNTLGIRDNKPLLYGLDNTTESNMAFTDATNTINVTSTGTQIAFVRCQQTDNKNTIAFTAATSSAPTSFLVNLYKVDFVNSRLIYINTSANLVSQLTSSEKWIFTTAGATGVEPGDVLASEFQVVGTGSVNVYGKTLTKPTHPVAQLAGAAATRSGTPGGAQASLGFTGLSFPGGLAIDSSGAVYTCTGNSVVKRLGTTQITLGFSGLNSPQGVAVDSTGVVYVADTSNNRAVKLSGSTQSVLGFTGLTNPSGIAVDSSGNIFVADTNNNRVVKLSGSTQSVLAFTGLSSPIGVAVDSSGAVYVASSGNALVKKLVVSTQTTLGFTGLSSPQGVAVDAAGSVYVASAGNNLVKKLAGATQTTVGFTGLSAPSAVAVDAAGSVIVTDTGNSRVVTFSNNTAFAALVFNNTSIPYIGLETSSPPPPSFPDHTTSYTTPGTTTQTIQTWVAHVDLIGMGGGGGGQGETGSTVGRGGSPGSWNTKTLVVGTDIPAGGLITITVAAGGAGGPYFTDGSAGTATTFSWVDPSGATQTLTASGGAGGGLGNGANLTIYGQATSPATETYQGVTYQGGGAQLVGAVGNPPGGSGPGGQPFQFGFAGARGQAWTVERQS